MVFGRTNTPWEQRIEAPPPVDMVILGVRHSDELRWNLRILVNACRVVI